MKFKWLGVWVVTAAITVAQSTVLAIGEEGQSRKRVVVKKLDGEKGGVVHQWTAQGEDGKHDIVIELTDDPAHNMLFLAAGDEDEARQAVNLSRLHHVDDVSENAGWLGVQLGMFENVENDVRTSGVEIINVAAGSAAEEAGFQQHDMIIEVDDTPVDAELGTLVNAIRDSGPGERMKFTVLRDGERRTLVAVLGRRGDVDNVDWIYETDHTLFRDSFKARAKVLLKDKDGEWVFEDADNGAFGSIMPGFTGKTVEVIQNGDDTSLSTSVTQDGVTLTVERSGDGSITVTRSDEDGNESVETYTDENALAIGDEEASDILENVHSHVATGVFDGDGDGNTFTFTLDGDVGFLDEIEEQIRTKKLEISDLSDKFKNLHMDVDVNAPKFRFFSGRATRTIHENADGSIEVITRKGDNELVAHYTDANDLADRDADAYEAYLDLQDE